MRPEKVCEVAYDQMEGNTVHGRRFRHAVKFLRWRPDREPESCTFDQLDAPLNYDLYDVLESLKWQARQRKSTSTASRSGSTNRDKPYFPKLGSDGTKGKLVDYYLSVADRMVALLRDRPVHLQRFPDGIDGEEIYQKRVPQKHPDYLETCTVTFPSGRTADALKVTHPSAIAWAAQMGTVTLHPWQVRCPDTEHPDELRIDLDPQPGTGFRRPGTSPSTCSNRCSTNSGWSATRRLPAGAACTSSCGSRPTGISSRCGGRASRWPARSSGAHPMR